MEMESSKGSKESEDKQMDWFGFLPDDILLDILKRVPDVFLRYKAKYVCTRWFRIITNRILLDHASCILQNLQNFKTRLVDIREEEEEEGIQVKEQYLDIPSKGMIRSWCNEFVLISHPDWLFIYNLITKERSYLPQCYASCGGFHGSICGLALCYDRFKGIYKVIHLIKGPPLQCEILVWRSGMVSSKWKKIQVPYINEGEYFKGDPVFVEGRYLHWDVIRNSDYLISMDIVKEEIFQTKLPGSGYYWRFFLSSFVIGGKLAKIEMDRGKAEIWILKDFEKKNKKWEKLHSVNVLNYLIVGRYPVSSVMSKRYIILESRYEKRLFSYDLKEGVVKEIKHSESYHHCVVHSSAPSFL